MPVRNGMPWLEEAVQSILAQELEEDFEVLIINDGSEDGTRDYLDSLRDERIRIVHFEDNKGIVEALNTGIALAKGKYLARMDADDVSLPQRFDLQKRFLDDNPDYGLVGTDIEAFSHISGSQIEQQAAIVEKWFNDGHSHDELKALLLLGNPITHPSVMFRKTVLEEVGGYRSEYEYAEDYDLFVRLSRITKMAKIPRKLLRYRVHPSQTSSKYAEKQREIDAKIKTRILIDHYLASDRKVLIWGAGTGGQKIVRTLKDAGVDIVGFIDNDDKKWGTYIYGVPVIGGESSIDKANADFVLIATSLGRSYAEQYLSNKGLQKLNDYLAVW
jgi:glycosyltransferase involved in cell wall biosynthesis